MPKSARSETLIDDKPRRPPESNDRRRSAAGGQPAVADREGPADPTAIGEDPAQRGETSNARGLDAFSPIRIRKASDEVLAVLIDAIRGGLYEPGDLLPPERDLALQLNVSRTVLRDAIEQLRAARILDVRRGSGGGTVVVSLENLTRVSARIQGETRANIRSLLDVRRPLECTAAALAAERASAEDIKSLRRLVATLGDVVDRPKEFWEVDIRFHFRIADISGNLVLADFLRETFNRLSVHRQQFPYAHVPYAEALHNQQVTLEALESRDRLRALDAMDDHLSSLEYVLLGRRLDFPPAVAASGA